MVIPRDCTCDNCLIDQPFSSGQCPLCWFYHNDRRYRKLWGGNPEDISERPEDRGRQVVMNFVNDLRSPPSQSAEYPSLTQQAINLNAEVKKWVEAGKPVTPKEEFDKRVIICQVCPNRDEKQDRCKICGCALKHVGFLGSAAALVITGETGIPGKLHMASAACPDRPPRWEAITLT